MAHKHWCDFAGHYWECEGSAIRLYQNEPTPCICITHGTAMDDGDHSNCSIELLACPEHRDDQMRAMGHDPQQPWPDAPETTKESSMFRDKDGNRTIGFCLWCNKDFYTHDEHEAHIADGMAACDVFQALKDVNCAPPVLEAMLERTEEPGEEESK